LAADLVITHVNERAQWAARLFARALWRVRPRLAICGHVHEARGVEPVRRGLEAPGNEEETLVWTDPERGSKKMALVDLSARGGDPLGNDRDSGAQCRGTRPDVEPRQTATRSSEEKRVVRT
jgi:hypothetical protein